MWPLGQWGAGHRAFSALYIVIVLRVEFKESKGQLNTGMNSSRLSLDSRHGEEAQKYLSHFLKENAQICKQRPLWDTLFSSIQI